MKRSLVIVVGIAIAGLFIEPASAQPPPSDQNNAVCTLRFTEYFSPGITLTTESGRQHSGEEVGSMNCSGKLQGHTITGPGTVGNEGVWHANCILDRSSGRYFATLPTDAGPMRIEGTYSLWRTGLTLTIDTEQPGARGSGSAVVIPSKGACITTPMTEALVVMTLTFQDENAPVRECDLDLGVVGVNCRSQSSAL